MTDVEWATCSESLEDGQPCIGSAVLDGLCLGHLESDRLDTYLQAVKAGGDQGGALDGRGAVISAERLEVILDAFRDSDGSTDLPRVAFGDATFGDGASFEGSTFGDGASFEGSTFGDWASFAGATFGDSAGFEHANFGDRAGFGFASFGNQASFGLAKFGRNSWFSGASFGDGASFDGATFDQGAWFDGATFGDKAWIDYANFGDGARFGPLMSTGTFDISGIHLPNLDAVEMTAEAIDARRLGLPDGGILRFNRARVDLTEVAFVQPTIISPGSASPGTEESTAETKDDRRPSIVSLERANVANLVLTDVKLEDCRFAGAHNLDRIRLEGDITFRRARGWIKALQRNRRQVLYEEAVLRDWLKDEPSGSGSPPGLAAQAKDEPPPPSLAPRRVEALYRALRKAREDGKDEPGAADFYYGEMEMRRLAAKRVSGERAILFAYKALSGYGIRASRALLALSASLLLFAGAFHLWGFADPADPFGRQASETEPSQPDNQTEPVAEGAPAQPAAEDLQGVAPNGNRSALQVMADGVIYSARTSINLFGGPELALTRWGSALQVVLRIWGPLLLGLVVLSLRGRVKR